MGWKISSIRSILTNEKYCGDVLGQKTYKEGVIGGKVQKNNGQLPQVLVQNNHPAIIRVIFIENRTGDLCVWKVVLLADPKKASPVMQLQ